MIPRHINGIFLSELAGILKGKVPDDIDRHSLREERIFSKYGFMLQFFSHRSRKEQSS